MQTREATDADLPAMRRLLDWPQLELGPARRGLVAGDDRGVTGALVVSCPVPEEAEILTLAVAPEHRRRGVGGALLQAFLEGRRGRVFLEVRPSNAAARQLYQRFGFTETGRRASYYQSPSEDAIVLEFVCFQ